MRNANKMLILLNFGSDRPGLMRSLEVSASLEDLAEAMQDTRVRLEMLTQYRRPLLELQAKAATNIDAAILDE